MVLGYAHEGVVGGVLVAAVVTAHGLYQIPKYEATAVVLVGQKEQNDGAPGIHPIPNAVPLGRLTQTMVGAIDTLPVAKETVRRLNLPRGAANELLDNLTAERELGTMRIRVTYTDTEPKRAQLVVNTVAQVASDLIPTLSGKVANQITATVSKEAKLPAAPVSPHPLRNGLIALVATLAVGTLIGAVRNL